MNDVDPIRSGAGSPGRQSLERLLRSAAQVKDETPVSMPFGFDTRVVALWRAGLGKEGNGLAHLLRQVAVVTVAIIVISTGAAIYELNNERENTEPFTNAFAIADSAIQAEVP